MVQLEQLTPGTLVTGLARSGPVTIISAQPHGLSAATVVFREASGAVGQQLVFRSEEHKLEVVEQGRPWAFDGDASLFRLVAEAQRIRLAYLFDPLLAVHISNVEALPHQLAAVYEEMLRRQPLRFLLADDPGSGKTIMAGLFIRELMLRGDLERCLVVCPAILAEQWQDELGDKFQLDFAIVGRADIEASRTGNPFEEHNLVISRVDLLKQDDNMDRLRATDWDLVIVDEAHKMSASYFGNDIKKTARYRLGELLGVQARHLLLLTATPHRGKDEDFQLFLALLDADRFEGKYRDGVHQVDPSDLMRRMLKEELVDFDGKRLFPERRAYTVNYELSGPEQRLYEDVTKYVTEEMNRADRSASQDGDQRRRAAVGFALTILQRRLASSPAAIHESLKRRMRKLDQRLREATAQHKAAAARDDPFDLVLPIARNVDPQDLEDDLEEEPEGEASEIVDLATAARTVDELESEVRSLKRLEALAREVRGSGIDKKWEQLAQVLDYPEMFSAEGTRRKLVIFTEHRDTLDYLVDKIGTRFGPDRLVFIHGSMLREARRNAQEKFLNDPVVQLLVATDAAGEGVNLQRAHLMVNYDLPWNPNRIEQRFGRIHRFGQPEICHLWNLVAYETREGAVYQRLFEKLEEEREGLGGKVYDVLGRAFTEIALRDLMVDAIRYNGSEEARTWAKEKVDARWDAGFLTKLVEEYALNATTLNAAHLRSIRETMERAEARRLVPHFIEAFFTEGFIRLGGAIRRREPRRYEITNVPSDLRRRDRTIGRGAALLVRYDRICFDKGDRHVDGKPPAAFVAPGHPLLDTVSDVLLERYRDLLRRGAVLIDDAEEERPPRVMFSVESVVTDGRPTRESQRRTVSRRADYLEVAEDGGVMNAGAAPYLDYRPPTETELGEVAAWLKTAPWLSPALERQAEEHAVTAIVERHFQEVRADRESLVLKTMAAVRERLLKEIQYWDHRAEELKLQELAGRTPRINSGNARRRAEQLEARLEARMKELEAERDLAPMPPVVTGGCLVLPARLFARPANPMAPPESTKEVEALAMAAVMEYESAQGRVPLDVHTENRGWDIESQEPSGRLRFIEVKGRRSDATTVCVSRNEWLTCMNKREDYYLAVVLVDGQNARNPMMIPDPVKGDSSFAVTSVNLNISDLMRHAVDLRPAGVAGNG